MDLSICLQHLLSENKLAVTLPRTEYLKRSFSNGEAVLWNIKGRHHHRQVSNQDLLCNDEHTVASLLGKKFSFINYLLLH